MGINSIITAGILSGAMVFGQTVSDKEFLTQENHGVYNAIPMYAHEINWADNTPKLNVLYDKGSIKHSNEILLYAKNGDVISDEMDTDIYNKYYGYKQLTDEELINRELARKGIPADILLDDMGISDSEDDCDKHISSDEEADRNSDISDINSSKTDIKDSNNASQNKSDIFMSNEEYIKLVELYQSAGYEHFILYFPVGEYEPLPSSKFEFFNLLPLSEMKTVDIYGFASPDGQKPKYQEELANKRMFKAIEYMNKENLDVRYSNHYVCDKDIARQSCWRADIFFKVK